VPVNLELDTYIKHRNRRWIST